MARYNDGHYDPRRWSTKKLINEIRSKANMETFGGYLETGYIGQGFPDLNNNDANAIREATRLYRDSWLNPLIDELERRIIKS